MKRPGLAAFLGFFFGPLGLFYISGKAGLVGLGIVIGLSIVTGGLAALPVWVACSIAGYVLAKNSRPEVAVFTAPMPFPMAANYPALPAPGAYPGQAGTPQAGGWAAPASMAQSVIPVPGPPTNAPAQASSKFCIACGQRLPLTARFCNKCGGQVA